MKYVLDYRIIRFTLKVELHLNRQKKSTQKKKKSLFVIQIICFLIVSSFVLIANSVFNKGKSVIPCQFNDSEIFSFSSDKAKLFTGNLSEKFEEPDMCFPIFPCITNWTLHNIHVTPKMVKMVIIVLYLAI